MTNVKCLCAEVVHGYDQGEQIFDILRPCIVMTTDNLIEDSYHRVLLSYKGRFPSTVLPAIIVAWVQDNMLYIDARVIESIELGCEIPERENFQIDCGSYKSITFEYWSSDFGVNTYRARLGAEWLTVNKDFWHGLPDDIKKFVIVTIPKYRTR